MKSSNRLRTLLRQAAAFVFGLVLLILTAGDLAAQTNTFPGTGNAGVGTTTPSQPLEIVGNVVTSGSQTMTTASKGVIEVTNTLTNNASSISAFRARNIFNGNSTGAAGLDIAPTFAPSLNVPLARGGIIGGFFAPPSGVTIDNVFGLNSVTAYNDVSGAVINGQTFVASVPIVFGALKPTNQFGVHIFNQGISGTTSSYGLFVDSQSGSTNNYAAIFAGGNVGIGTTTPSAPLDIFSSTTLAAGSASLLLQGNSNTERFYMRSANSNSTQVGPFFMGQGGSGTIASPGPPVANTTLAGFFGGGYNSASWVGRRGGLVVSAAENWDSTHNGTYLSFETTPIASTTKAEVMRITSAGYVGIGTTSPSRMLQLFNATGSAVASFTTTNTGATATDGFYVGLTNTDQKAWMWNYENAALGFGTNNLERVTIQNDGKVGIGTTSPLYPLHVTGQVFSTGGFRFNDSSVQDTAATMTGVTAGDGLIGGGTSGTATINIGAGPGVTVAADNISVNYGSGPGTSVEGNKQIVVNTTEGISGGATLTLGSGGTLNLTNTNKGSDQSIFKNIADAAGTTQFSAGSNTDALRFEGIGGTTVSFTGGSTKKVTIDSSGITSSQWTSGSGNINYTSGNVGIGTASPTSKLHVTGDGKITGNLTVDGTINAKYQDVAEWVPSSEQLSAGTVVVLDQTKSNQVISSTISYDTRVAGVISEQPGITLGESGAGKVLVATTGRVRVKVDATRGPIQIGDLLVTSDVSGLAMKSEPIELGGRKMHMPGTLIGKALEPLAKGKGEILVLLSLQ